MSRGGRGRTNPASRGTAASGVADLLVLAGVAVALAATAFTTEPGEATDELDRLRAEVAQLRRAMATRPVIDQARGMVMAVGRCTPQTAWEVLVEVSQRTNTKLHTVAARLVATTAGDPLPEPIRAALHAALWRRTPRSRRR